MKISLTITLPRESVLQIEELSGTEEALRIFQWIQQAVYAGAGAREPGQKTVEVIYAEPGERLRTIPALGGLDQEVSCPVSSVLSADPVSEAFDVSPESLREAMQAFANQFGLPAAKELLKTHGVNRTSELMSEGRIAVLADISKALS